MMSQSAKRVEERIEEMRRRVRAMERGGDLDSLLNRECKEVSRLLREEMLAERERHAASGGAAFPPLACPHCASDRIVELGMQPRRPVRRRAEIT